MKKPPQKVTYLSRNSVVSEIFHLLPTVHCSAAQQPNWQNSCSKMWPIEQLYIELGVNTYITIHLIPALQLRFR